MKKDITKINNRKRSYKIQYYFHAYTSHKSQVHA